MASYCARGIRLWGRPFSRRREHLCCDPQQGSRDAHGRHERKPSGNLNGSWYSSSQRKQWHKNVVTRTRRCCAVDSGVSFSCPVPAWCRTTPIRRLHSADNVLILAHSGLFRYWPGKFSKPVSSRKVFGSDLVSADDGFHRAGKMEKSPMMPKSCHPATFFGRLPFPITDPMHDVFAMLGFRRKITSRIRARSVSGCPTCRSDQPRHSQPLA